MTQDSRYLIGIDLGTTNSLVSYIDTSQNHKIVPFLIRQKTERGSQGTIPYLPSFLYFDEEEDIVGEYARKEGAKIPTRLVHSAKSWLCNSSIDRKEKILPLEAADSTKRIAPVDAVSRFLIHIKEMWNQEMGRSDPANEFEASELILTIPASFDEVARGQTLLAAQRAGLERVTLLEEPQAAFYSWIDEHEKFLEERKGELVLVCDVGGGTTDFTLKKKKKGEEIIFDRKAVGDHLLLGGDNMDAALAFYLDASPSAELIFLSSQAKEMLLSDNAPECFSFFLGGRGSSVVGGGREFTLTQSEIQSLLLDGFFGLYSLDEALCLKRGSGIRKMGLPFESEPSITKHLATFLKKHQAMPDAVLFNGGGIKPSVFRERIKACLELWSGKQVTQLKPIHYDRAVSRGAAYYGKVRRGHGFRIGGGAPRGIYLEIDVKTPSGEIEKKALTLLPKGTQEGTKLSSSHLFSLTPNTPVSFQLYHSTSRSSDLPGSLTSIEEERMAPFPPLYTFFRFGKQTKEIPVKMGIHLTEVGTLNLWLDSVCTEHHWDLEFQMRSHGKRDEVITNERERGGEEAFDASLLQAGKEIVKEAFTFSRGNRLMKTLEVHFNRSRNAFPPSLLRALFDVTMECCDKRKLSTEYAERFWNGAGFFLRPGRGFPLDDFRITELWKLFLADGVASSSDEVMIQQLICVRRIASGLSRGQQLQLWNALFSTLFNKKRGKDYLLTEILRALGALERVNGKEKEKLGQFILKRILKNKGTSADYWSLARLGSRNLLYGSIGNLLAPKLVEQWIDQLLMTKELGNPHLAFALAMMARKTDVQEMNLSTETLAKVEESLANHADLGEILHTPLSSISEQRLFGDHLPSALSLMMAS